MVTELLNSLVLIFGLTIGILVGKSFGSMQHSASLHNKQSGRSLLAILPGSIGRVIILLLMLVFIQILFPFLFNGLIRWLVSVGVISGYGWSLLQRLNAGNSRQT